jgi:hypothetical protein
MSLYRPDGSLIATSSGDATQATLGAFALDQTGSYTLQCQDSTVSETNLYAVTFVQVLGDNLADEGAMSLPPGGTRSGGFSLGDIDVLHFSANAGDLAMLRLAMGSASTFPGVQVYGPDGNLITVGATTNKSATILPQRLAQSGIYTVLCQDSSTFGTNQYGVTLTQVLAANPDDEDAAVLTPGVPHTGQFSLGDIDVLRFSAATGDVISVQLAMRSASTFPKMYLYDPDGHFVAAATSDEKISSLSSLLIHQSGTFTLVCWDDTGSAINDYAVLLSRGPMGNGITTLTPGETRNGTFTSESLDVYQFSASAGDVVTARLAEQYSSQKPAMYLYGPDGSLVAKGALTNNDALIWERRLSQSGTHTLICWDGTIYGSSQYALTLVNLSAVNPGDEDGGTIQAGETRKATFSLGDIDLYRFTATGGDLITLQLKAQYSSIYPSFYLYGPNGTMLTSLVAQASSQVALVLRGFSLPQTGLYTVLCQDKTIYGTDPYALTFVNLAKANPGDEDGGDLLAGQTRKGSFSLGDLDAYRFSAAAGDLVRLQLKTLYSSVYPSLSLYGPSGILLTSLVAQSASQAALLLPALRLPDTGTYTVLCEGKTTYGSDDYALTLMNLAGQNPGDEQGGTLIPGQTRTGDFTLGDIDSYQFTGAAGEVITLQLMSQYSSQYPTLSLYGPSGTVVTSLVAQSASQLSIAARTLRLPETGSYTVLCQDSTTYGQNEYAVTLMNTAGPNPGDEEGGTLEPGLIRTGTFTFGDIDAYQFSGTNGEMVTVQMTTRYAGQYPSLFLHGPSGNIITSLVARSGSVLSLAIHGLSLAETGMYTVLCQDGTTYGVNDYQLELVFPPHLTMPPNSTNADVTSSIKFGVTAEGTGAFAYQWRKNGVNIRGATNQTFTITNVQIADGGSYSVVVASTFDAVTSDPALLVVNVNSQAPPGDNFASRSNLVGLSGFAAGTNSFATRELFEPYHARKYGTNSIWYTWRSPTNGIATFRTVGSTFDTLLAVYTGTTLNSLLPVADDEDSGGFLTSEAQFNAIKDMDYQIAVDGFAGQRGSFTLGWELETTTNTLPTITSAPASQTVIQGSMASFSIGANGSGLTYQWYFNHSSIARATNAELRLTSVQPSNVGFYAVAVTNNALRGVLSDPATLEIGSEARAGASEDKLEDLAFPPATLSQSGLHLSAASLSAPPPYSVGAGSIGFQVLNNGDGTTSASEENHCGVICHSTRWLFLQAASSGTLVVTATGSNFLPILEVYGWSPGLVDGVCGMNVAEGLNTRRVSKQVASGTNAIVVDGVAGATGLIQLNWALGTAPLLTNSYADLSLWRGSQATLRAAIGTAAVPPPTYQWLLNDLPILGATNSFLILTNVDIQNGGRYSVAVSNMIGGDKMTIATVVAQPDLISLAESTFENTAESWSLAGSQRPLVFSSTAGNPLGCLSVTAGLTNETWYWSAGPAFQGNFSGAYGGWLQFDLNDSAVGALATNEPLVVLTGAGSTLVYFESTIPATNSTGWRTYRVPLSERASGAEGRWFRNAWLGSQPTNREMASILSSLTSLWIRGKANPGRSGRLDTVALLAVDPRLTITRLGADHISLRWQVTGIDYLLTASDALTLGTWTTNFPIVSQTISNAVHQTTVLSPSPRRFFRLMAPP